MTGQFSPSFLYMFFYICFLINVFLYMFSYICFLIYVFLYMFSYICFPIYVFLYMLLYIIYVQIRHVGISFCTRLQFKSCLHNSLILWMNWSDLIILIDFIDLFIWLWNSITFAVQESAPRQPDFMNELIKPDFIILSNDFVIRIFLLFPTFSWLCRTESIWSIFGQSPEAWA